MFLINFHYFVGNFLSIQNSLSAFYFVISFLSSCDIFHRLLHYF